MKKKTTTKARRAPAFLPPAKGYAVRFRIQIHGSFSAISSEDVWMERTVTLPIPPCIGMEVSQGDWSATIDSLYLPLDRGTIEVFVEEDKEIYNAQLRREPHRPLAEIVKEYRKSGWKVTPDRRVA